MARAQARATAGKGHWGEHCRREEEEEVGVFVTVITEEVTRSQSSCTLESQGSKTEPQRVGFCLVEIKKRCSQLPLSLRSCRRKNGDWVSSSVPVPTQMPRPRFLLQRSENH